MRFKSLLLFLALVFVGATAHAQSGSITGQVFDPAGAIINNAKLTATSVSTGISQTVGTSSSGVYTFAALLPATYDVTATAAGFQTVTKRNVILNVAATLPLNFTLSVAATTASVEVVNAAAQQVETNSAELSTVIDAQQIQDLPLVLRDPYQLVLLSPGAVTASNNIGGFSVNGQRDRNNNFLLDGVDNNDTSVPGIPGGIVSANPDSTQEFRVISNNFDVEVGRNTGAVIDVVTRGGTNHFHGDAYEFGRYNALGARDFFNTKDEGPQDPYVRNDFGASVGGPILKDHTFFFLNGEVQRFRTTLTDVQTTPTAAFKSGVFTFIDPYDGSQTPVDLTTLNPNNYSGMLQDPTISKILALAPVGIDNGDGVSTTYNFASPDALNDYTLTGRLDQRLSDKHQLSVRYVYGHSNESDPFHDEVLPGYGATSSIASDHNASISLTSALTPNTTNVFKAGFNLNNDGFFCAHDAIDSVLGVDSFGNGRDVAVPYFFTATSSSGNFGCWDLGDSNGQARLSSTLGLADTFTTVKGSHTFKFGGEYRDVKDSTYNDFSSRDLLSLNNFETFGAESYAFQGNPNSPSLLDFEDLVWGATGAVANAFENQFFTAAGTRRANDLDRFVQHEWAIFAQDTWKVNSHLTLVAGMRYAFNGVPYEKNGNFSNFFGNASAPLPASGVFSFTDVGPGTGRQLYSNSWGLYEPRVGFSLDPNGDGRTAIRGGFGIFHDRIFDNLFGNARSNPPFESSFNDYPFDGTPTTATVTTYPSPGDLTPSPDITNGDYFEAVTIDPNLKMPTDYSYSLGVQHQLRSGLIVEANYVGNHGTHGLREIDGAPPQPNLVAADIAAGIQSSALTLTSLYLGGTDGNGNTFAPAVNNTAFYHDLLQTGRVSSNYNALQTKVQGTAHRVSLMASYTYAHALDNGSDPLAPGAGDSGLPRNSFDLGPEYGNSDADVKHRGTIAASYNLPVGRGGSYLNSGLLGRVFEGIEISGIEQVQTGLPFDLRGTVDNLHTSVLDRPELVGNPYPSGRGKLVAQGVITGPSVTAFANAPYDQSVSIHRNTFYGPGFVNTDAVFQKTQSITEGVKLVFRAESYNVLNHPNFNSPTSGSLSIASPTFGVSTSEVEQNDGTTGARQIQGALKVVF